jgi:oligopeptidase A
MNDLNSRRKLNDNEVMLPAAFIVCNQMKPVDGKPSCMTYGEVTTLFHEFGHAIQHLLTKQDIEEVSGINGVEWDAVELASQFMENWATRKEVLKDISEHVTTGEALPDELIEKIKLYDHFRAASGMQRQLNFGYMDMLLHSQYPSDKYQTIAAIEDEAARRFPRAKRIPNEHFLCTFSHIFAGGYAAGYYSYMWADILAADAYRAFEELGDNEEAIQKLGRRYTDTILGLGGAYHPMEVFVNFRGREPNPDSILLNLGLI